MWNYHHIEHKRQRCTLKSRKQSVRPWTMFTKSLLFSIFIVPIHQCHLTDLPSWCILLDVREDHRHHKTPRVRCTLLVGPRQLDRWLWITTIENSIVSIDRAAYRINHTQSKPNRLTKIRVDITGGIHEADISVVIWFEDLQKNNNNKISIKNPSKYNRSHWFTVNFAPSKYGMFGVYIIRSDCQLPNTCVYNVH